MKKIAILALLPSAALAHPGDHSGMGPDHALTSPDHLALLIAVAAVGFVVWALVRR